MMIGADIAADQTPVLMPRTIRMSRIVSLLIDQSSELIHALVPVFLRAAVGASTAIWTWRRALASRFRATAALAFIAGTVGCSAAGSPNTASPPTPELKAHCRDLYGLWTRYNSRDQNHSGEHAQAELALSDCQRGRFDTGLAELEQLLREDEIPFPRRRDESASWESSPSPKTAWTVEATKPICSSDMGVRDPSC